MRWLKRRVRADSCQDHGSRGRKVTLLNVVRIDTPYSELPHFDMNGLRKAYFTAARKYLADVEARLGTEGIRVKTELSSTTGRPPPSRIMP